MDSTSVGAASRGRAIVGHEGVRENRATEVRAKFWIMEPPDATKGDMRLTQASVAAGGPRARYRYRCTREAHYDKRRQHRGTKVEQSICICTKVRVGSNRGHTPALYTAETTVSKALGRRPADSVFTTAKCASIHSCTSRRSAYDAMRALRNSINQ